MRLAIARKSSELGVLDEARSPSTADGVIEEDRMRFLRRIIGLRRRKESDTVGKEDSERILEMGLRPSQIRYNPSVKNIIIMRFPMGDF